MTWGKCVLLQKWQSKKICKTIRQYFHYTIKPLEGFILKLIEDSGFLNFSLSIYPRETKCLSVRDKIINGNLEIYFKHINTTNCVVLLRGNLNKIQIWEWVVLFQHNLFFYHWFLWVWKHAKKEPFWTHLDTGCSVKISFYLIRWWLYHHIIYLLAFIDQHTTCFEFFLESFSNQRKICVYQ